MLPASVIIIALMMEAVSTYETSVNFYHTTQCNISEDSHLHSCRHENMKFHGDNLFGQNYNHN
jgi:hypothetical protein